MDAFLKSACEKPPEEDVLQTVVQAFAKFKWHSKEALVGAVDADTEALRDKDTPVPVKVLMRNAARVANAASNSLLANGTSQKCPLHFDLKDSVTFPFLEYL